MGKRFLFLAILLNAVLIAFSAVQSRAETATAAQGMAQCCSGGQCVTLPGYQCIFKMSCTNDGECGAALTP